MTTRTPPPAAVSPAPLEIFRAGTHAAMSGETFCFSDADLVATAAAYNPSVHEAPIVIGHPRHDAPAYGWVKSLAVQGGCLVAAADQVDPAFAELVSAGRYKKISASFYAPDAPNNPTPGVFALRHVGFLGAQPPAVKGLRSPEFADDEAGVIAFGDWDDRNNASMWRSLRDWFIAKFGLEEADRAVPPWKVDDLQASAAQPDIPAPDGTTAFSDAVFSPSFPQKDTTVLLTPEQQAALAADNARLKAELDAARAREAQAKTDQRRQGHVDYAESLIRAGHLAPKHKSAVVDVLCAAGGDKVIAFADSDCLVTAIKGFLEDQKVVEFGEFATGARAGAGAEKNPLIADAEARK